MAASRVPETLTALHALAVTAMTGVTIGSQPNITVERGPYVSSDPGAWLFVGYDGDPGGDFRAVRADSEWVGLGANRREERFEVACGITVTSGDGDVTAATEDAYALHAVFEAALRADPSLGLTPTPFVAEVDAGDLWTMPHPAGLQVRLSFVVKVRTRI